MRLQLGCQERVGGGVKWCKIECVNCSEEVK